VPCRRAKQQNVHGREWIVDGRHKEAVLREDEPGHGERRVLRQRNLVCGAVQVCEGGRRQKELGNWWPRVNGEGATVRGQPSAFWHVRLERRRGECKKGGQSQAARCFGAQRRDLSLGARLSLELVGERAAELVAPDGRRRANRAD